VTDEGRMAYIDSELAKRRSEGQVLQTAASTSLSRADGRQPESERKKEKELQRQPATLGKLQEIDLGDEARDRNVAQTERARRRLDGEAVEEEGEKKIQKARLGPDGKPWRGRKRRGSDDVKRDKLVDDVLRENRRMCPLHMSLPIRSVNC
jgi:Hepatocellular carcinoma-associated antigen 59